MIRLAGISSFSRVAFALRRRPTLAATFASNSSSSNNNNNNQEWRKKQLDTLENKFLPPNEIKSDDELQPMWKEMESRVTRRKPLTKEQTGGKTGRRNIKKTDEEAWLQAGLYDNDSDDDEEGGGDDQKG